MLRGAALLLAVALLAAALQEPHTAAAARAGTPAAAAGAAAVAAEAVRHADDHATPHYQQAPAPPDLITINEQLQQADALGVTLTPEQLARANPLLGARGRLKDPVRARPADWPDG
jgi:hypothetical protein